MMEYMKFCWSGSHKEIRLPDPHTEILACYRNNLSGTMLSSPVADQDMTSAFHKGLSQTIHNSSPAKVFLYIDLL
jgi:hypothetical protein